MADIFEQQAQIFLNRSTTRARLVIEVQHQRSRYRFGDVTPYRMVFQHEGSWIVDLGLSLPTTLLRLGADRDESELTFQSTGLLARLSYHPVGWPRAFFIRLQTGLIVADLFEDEGPVRNRFGTCQRQWDTDGD